MKCKLGFNLSSKRVKSARSGQTHWKRKKLTQMEQSRANVSRFQNSIRQQDFSTNPLSKIITLSVCHCTEGHGNENENDYDDENDDYFDDGS